MLVILKLILNAILHALPPAAAVGALLSVFIDPDTEIFGIRGNKLLGTSVFLLLFIILSSAAIYGGYEHRQRINYVERNIAFLIAGRPLTIEQIQDYFFKPNLDDIEEALDLMERDGSVQSSKQDAMVMSKSNLPVTVRLFTLSRR